MIGRLLLYGAAGFSGRLIAEALLPLGVDLVLAGRDGAKLAPLARLLDAPYRVFALDDEKAIDESLADIAAVLHCAGPFRQTGAPMMAACIRTGTHYLDLAGEWPVFVDAMGLGAAAAAAGIMVMPGIGFSITASDCLLALAVARVPDATILRLAISQPEHVSRGTMRSMLDLISPTVQVRRDGALETVPVGRLSRYFDFGAGPRKSVAVTGADVVTGQFTTGVATIETYTQADWTARLAFQLGALAAPWRKTPAAQAMRDWVGTAWSDGPSETAREEAGFVLVVEAIDPWRRSTLFRLRTQDGYAVTTSTASEIVRRVLNDEFQPGFCTPGALFGGNFIVNLGCASLDAAVF